MFLRPAKADLWHPGKTWIGSSAGLWRSSDETERGRLIRVFVLGICGNSRTTQTSRPRSNRPGFKHPTIRSNRCSTDRSDRARRSVGGRSLFSHAEEMLVCIAVIRPDSRARWARNLALENGVGGVLTASEPRHECRRTARSSARRGEARPICLRLLRHCVRRPRSFAGRSSDARMAMRAMTTSNSIKVNASGLESLARIAGHPFRTSKK